MNYQREVSTAFATITEMLRDRGVDASSCDGIAGEDVLALAGSRPVFAVDLPSCRTRVLYDLNARFRLVDVRKLLEDDAVETYLIVTRDSAGPTSAAVKGVQELGRDTQFFELRELQYNVTRHHLVPPHRAIRDAPSIDDVLRRYRLQSRYLLPIIQTTDPVARYLGLKPGQLVEITRPSPSAGVCVVVRCCARA